MVMPDGEAPARLFHPDDPRVDAGVVARITDLDNDLTRTRAIALAYHHLGHRLRHELGLAPDDRAPIATWWDFATWAATTICGSIDPACGWRCGRPLHRSWMSRRIPGQIVTMSRHFLAKANRLVFDEMGNLACTLLDNAEIVTGADDRAFEDFLEGTIDSTARDELFGPGDIDLLHYGIRSLRHAVRAGERPVRRGKALVSALALLEYEQRRLHAYIDVLMSGRPLSRWRELRSMLTYDGSLVRPGLVRRQIRELSTMSIHMRFRHENVALGVGSTELAGEDVIPLALPPSDRRYVERWTRSEEVRPRRSWHLLDYRMSAILVVFDQKIDSSATIDEPFSPQERDLVERAVDPRTGRPTIGLRTDDPVDLSRLDDGRSASGPVDPATDHTGPGEAGPWPDEVARWVHHHAHLDIGEMIGLVLGTVGRSDPEPVAATVRHQLFDHPRPVPFGSLAEHEDAVRRSRQFFRSHLPTIGAGLLFGVLPADLASAEAAAVLHRTGGFRHDTARRISTTAQFVFAVMNTGWRPDRPPDRHLIDDDGEEDTPFGSGGRTLLAIRQLRVVHHVLRCWCHEQGTWGTLNPYRPVHDDGVPAISLEEQVGTILSFTVALWHALANLGVDRDELGERAEDWYQTWRWVGLVFGIPDEHLPRTHDDARERAHQLARRNLRPSSAGFELARELVTEMRQAWPAPTGRTPQVVAARLASAAIHHVSESPSEVGLPGDVADILALPDPPVLARLRVGASLGSIGQLPPAQRRQLAEVIVRQHQRRWRPRLFDY